MASVIFTDSVAGTGFAFQAGREYIVGESIAPEQAAEFVRTGQARPAQRGPALETAIQPEPEFAAERISSRRGRHGRRSA